MIEESQDAGLNNRKAEGIEIKDGTEFWETLNDSNKQKYS